jgi:O-antigen/teichoic acid export membrane protein
MLRILIRNILSNWAGFGVQVVVAFFLTPFILHSLGEMRYGIWALVTGLTGYYGLLDLGFRSGITQYLARHLATRNFEQMNRVASTAIAALGICGALIAVVSALLSWLAPHIFTIPAEAIAETRICISVIGVSTAISFVFFTFSAVFAATQRYDMANAISIIIRLITAGVMVAALKLGYGLVGISVVNAASEIIGYMLRVIVAYRILPELNISMTLVTRDVIKYIGTYSIWNLIITGSSQLISYSDAIVIGIFMPVKAIAPFSLAVSLTNYIANILASATVVFFPAATKLHAQNDVDGLRSLYFNGSKMMLHLAITVSLVPALYAVDFFRLWVGSEFADGVDYPPTSLLFQILLASLVVSASPRIGSQVLAGALRIRLLACIFIIEGIANLLLSLLLIRYFGLIGVAVGTLLPSLCIKGIIQPIILCRSLDIPLSTYLKQVCLRPCISGSLCFIVLLVIRYYDEPASNWTSLFFHCSLAFMLVLINLIFIGLNQPERQLLIIQPLASALRFVKSTRYRTGSMAYDENNVNEQTNL